MAFSLYFPLFDRSRDPITHSTVKFPALLSDKFAIARQLCPTLLAFKSESIA